MHISTWATPAEAARFPESSKPVLSSSWAHRKFVICSVLELCLLFSFVSTLSRESANLVHISTHVRQGDHHHQHHQVIVQHASDKRWPWSPSSSPSSLPWTESPPSSSSRKRKCCSCIFQHTSDKWWRGFPTVHLKRFKTNFRKNIAITYLSKMWYIFAKIVFLIQDKLEILHTSKLPRANKKNSK